MNGKARKLLAIAGLNLCIATALGAWSAHGLERLVDTAAVDGFRTAVQYHFYHGLGLIGIVLVLDRLSQSRAVVLSAWLMLIGTVLFSGTIYVNTFVALGPLNLATPVGGVAFMAGWLALAYGALKA